MLKISGRSLAILLTASLAICGCGTFSGPAKPAAKTNASQLVDEFFAHQQEFDVVLESIVDVPTAKAARPVMEQAYDKMLRKATELDEANRLAYVTGALTEVEMKELDHRVSAQKHESDERNRSHMARVQDEPEIMAILQPLFDRIRSGPLM